MHTRIINSITGSPEITRGMSKFTSEEIAGFSTDSMSQALSTKKAGDGIYSCNFLVAKLKLLVDGKKAGWRYAYAKCEDGCFILLWKGDGKAVKWKHLLCSEHVLYLCCRVTDAAGKSGKTRGKVE